MADKVKANDFLKKFFNQYHFNQMPVGVRAKFDDFVKNNTLTQKQKGWERNFLKHDKNGNLVKAPDGGYERNDLLSVQNDMEDEQIAKLYDYFQKAFMGMSSSKNSFKDKNQDAVDFLDKYFGPSALFNIQTAMPECERAIVNIVDVIHQQPDIAKYLLKNLKNDKGDENLFPNQNEFNKFLSDVSAKKYNSDYKVQQKIIKVADCLASAIQWGSGLDTSSTEYQALTSIKNDLDTVMAEDAFSGKDAGYSNKFNHFKDGVAEELLKELYNNEKAFEEFQKHDNSNISSSLNAAKENIKWNDKSSYDFVPEKKNDELNLYQQIEKWKSDTYSNCFKKYEQLRGNKLFFGAESKKIFNAIDKNKIKPSDGLGKVLENADKIKDKIEDGHTKEHFDWFVKTITPLKDSMPKAFAGAWKNGKQMKAIVDEIILTAVNPQSGNASIEDNMKKAKTAMEIMTAMKYGAMTSKIMDALKKEDFTIFSDSGLSWNKDEGVKFVTTAFDKSVKTAFLMTGYAVTAVGNKIALSNRKIKNKDNHKGARLADAFNKEKNRLTNQKNSDIAEKNLAVAETNRRINDNQNKLNTLQAAGYSEYTKASKEREKENWKTIKEQNKQSYDTFNDNENIIHEYTNKQNEIQQIDNDIQTATNEKTSLESTLSNPFSRNAMTPEEQAETQYKIQQLDDFIHGKQTEKQQINNSLNDPDEMQKYQDAQIYNSDQVNIDAHNTYETAAQNENEIKTKLAELKNANDEIAELNKSINDRNIAMANWDQEHQNRIIELENYWNFLQTGKNVSFFGRAKNAQKRFDKNKKNLLQNYINSHGLAA
ncbi:MAG: hypothetical protein ACLRFI_04230 [Alphaproteobacteria bacterium]